MHQLTHNEIYKVSGAGPLDGVKAVAKKVYDGAGNLVKTIYDLPWGEIVFYTGLAAATGAAYWFCISNHDGHDRYDPYDDDIFGFDEVDPFYSFDG